MFPDRGQKTTTYATPYESQQPVVGPGMVQSNASCAAFTYPSATLHNPIMQQVDYRVGVAGALGAEQRWPLEYQHMTWSYYGGNFVPQQMH